MKDLKSLNNLLFLIILEWSNFGYCFIGNFGIDEFGNTYQRVVVKSIFDYGINN